MGKGAWGGPKKGGEREKSSTAGPLETITQRLANLSRPRASDQSVCLSLPRIDFDGLDALYCTGFVISSLS